MQNEMLEDSGQADATEITPEMMKAAYAAFRQWDAIATELPCREAARDAFLRTVRLTPASLESRIKGNPEGS